MTLKRLLKEIEYEKVIGDTELKIKEISCDSRKLKKGDLFVACKGENHDGHEYIKEAISKGAVAAVGEREFHHKITYIKVSDSRKALADLAAAFYDHPTKRLFTVGITGTNGKTTTAHLSRSILGEKNTEIISTIVNNLERGSANTTPNPLQIQKIAYEALSLGKKNLVLEASAHGLSQHRVRSVDFDVAVFTNLTHDHLDYFGNFTNYMKAKLLLFSSLKKDGVAIINLDDPHGEEFIKSTPADVLTYGLNSKADLFADRIKLFPHSSSFRVHTPKGTIPIKTRLPGRFNIYNILAAVGVSLKGGIPLDEIKAGIEAVKNIPGRFERYMTKDGVFIVIDFAHSPDGLQKIIEALKPFHRVITVFGCGGEADRAKRPIMGRISGYLSDYTIITSDNPKGEDPEMIIKEIETGISTITKAYETIVDRGEAIKRALEIAKRGDVVLIAGKGHERTQVFKGKEIKFSDRLFLQEMGMINL
jgi:UDP-N-acetylmuramoyl-L-alanyl-D-glutamate--2,6-diaminopimelate ligase